MATTKIHAIKATVNKALLYIENPDKTDGQQLVSGYNCAPQQAAVDFEITSLLAAEARNIKQGKSPNLAYHLIQAFSPEDNVTPEQAHEIGKKLASEFTDGKFEYVIATHVDKGHIHNHVIINAVSFYDYKKLRTVPYKTARQIRNISDRLCTEAELSIVENPEKLGQQYSKYIKKRKQTPARTEIRRRLNFCLARATDYEQFKQMVSELGIRIDDTGKYCTYHYEGSKRPVRDNKLSDTDKYTVSGLKEQLANNAAGQDFVRKKLDEIMPHVSTSDELFQKLKEIGIQSKVNRKTGAVSYLADEHDEDWIPEDALGIKYLLRKETVAETPSLLSRYLSTVRTRPDTPDTMVRITTDQIMKSSTRGLLLQVTDTNGNPASLMLDSDHVEATPDGRMFIALGGLFEYDLRYPDGKHGYIRGGELVKQIELQNHVEPVTVSLTAGQIKSMSLKGVTVTLPDKDMERVFIPNEFVNRDPLQGICTVNLYANWDYSYVPIGEDKTRRNMKGKELAAALGKVVPSTADTASLQKRIAMVERKAGITNAKHLAHIMGPKSRPLTSNLS